VKASIIVPCYGTQHLAVCIAAVRRNTIEESPLDSYELILVNDATPDINVGLLMKAMEPGVLVDSARHRHFSGTCNLGAAVADAYSDVLIFLNSDAAVHPGWITPLLTAFQEDECVQMAGPRVRKPEGPWNDYGKELYDGKVRDIHQVGPLTPDPIMPVFCPAGCCMAIRRSAFVEMNGFDTEYKNSCEDVDFAARVQIAHKDAKIVTHRQSGVDHLYEQSKYIGGSGTDAVSAHHRFNVQYEGFARVQ